MVLRYCGAVAIQKELIDERGGTKHQCNNKFRCQDMLGS